MVPQEEGPDPTWAHTPQNDPLGLYDDSWETAAPSEPAAMTTDPFATRDPGDPSTWPIGSRVVVPGAEDMHFFRRGSTGVVVRHADRRYLGVIVELDDPYICDHGHYQHEVREFNFSARNLAQSESIR